MCGSLHTSRAGTSRFSGIFLEFRESGDDNHASSSYLRNNDAKEAQMSLAKTLLVTAGLIVTVLITAAPAAASAL
jgi:hypothetical protein